MIFRKIVQIKKREWNHKEKQKSDEMGYIEVIPFEKLNKTIDLFDMMKPQYSTIIDEKYVDIWYKIAWREKKFLKGESFKYLNDFTEKKLKI